MNLDPKIIEMILEYKKNRVVIEKNFLDKNVLEDKNNTSNVQIGDSTLIFSKIKTSQSSRGEGQEVLNQLGQIEQRMKLYYETLDAEDSLTNLKDGLSVRGGKLGKSGPGPRAKADARKNSRKSYLRKRNKLDVSPTKHSQADSKHRRLFQTNTGTIGNSQNPAIDQLAPNRPTKSTKLTLVKSEGLDESGVSINRDEFSEKTRQIEEQSSRRRRQPTVQSKVDPRKYYAEEQDVVKGKTHLGDFKINIEGMSDAEIAQAIFEISEGVLSHPDTEIYYGTLNVEEDVVIALDRSTRTVAIYEDHPIYYGEQQHHITTYKANPNLIDELDKSRKGINILNENCNPALTTIKNKDGLTSRTRGPNIGESIAEKKLKITAEKEKRVQREIAKQKRSETSIMAQLEPHERISHKQLRKAEEIEARLKQNSSYVLELDKNDLDLLNRAENHRKGMKRLEGEL